MRIRRTNLDARSRACAKCGLVRGKAPGLVLVLRLLLAAVFILPAFGAGAGATVTDLHAFSAYPYGGSPLAGLVQGSDGNFYGTTLGGGTNNAGTVFKISATGTLTSLYSFTGGNDGASPFAAPPGS
jgi:uncharacterized repeat protein (TIGR03803 family)